MPSGPDDVTYLDPDAPPPAPESRIGAYRLVRELGQGGMGTVFLAVRDDDVFHKRVALKVRKRGMDHRGDRAALPHRAPDPGWARPRQHRPAPRWRHDPRRPALPAPTGSRASRGRQHPRNPNYPNIGDHAAALVEMQKSAAVFERASARYPDSRDALAPLERAMAIQDQIATADPENARARAQTATNHGMRGRLLAKLGQRAGAMTSLDRTVDISRTLAASNPDNVEWRIAVASALIERGDAWVALGRQTGQRGDGTHVDTLEQATKKLRAVRQL